MEVSWLPLLVSAAVLAAIFLLLVVCVDCTNQGPMAHISQRSPSEDDVLSNRFIVIHPQSTRPVMDVTPAHPSSVLLSPHPNSAEAGFWRPTTPTETESNPSYENSGTPPARQESDGEDTGYIIVLPENDPEKRRASTPSTDGPNCSSSSSSSSADNLHEYVNVESPGSSNYLNVVPSSNNATNGPSFSDDDDDDDDDDDNNYVNQPPVGSALHHE